MCPVMDIFQKGKAFVCNEIADHLHPLMVRQLVFRFIRDGASEARILYVTLDVEMLNLNLFRLDRIWFTDINPDGHLTVLRPLSSFQCRKDENVQKESPEGKFCKVARDFWME